MPPERQAVTLGTRKKLRVDVCKRTTATATYEHRQEQPEGGAASRAGSLQSTRSFRVAGVEGASKLMQRSSGRKINRSEARARKGGDDPADPRR